MVVVVDVAGRSSSLLSSWELRRCRRRSSSSLSS